MRVWRGRGRLPVYVVHAWVATVGWEVHLSVAGAAEELAEELVEVGEEEAVGGMVSC